MKHSEPTSESEIHAAHRLDRAVAYRIHRANRLLTTHLARVLETSLHGLTPEKWFVLARIRDDAPVRQGALTDPTLEDAPNISRLVDGLVEAGLVERHPDPDDRRGRVLTLSQSGTELAEQLHERSVVERRRVFDGMAEADLAALVSMLDQLEANVRPRLNPEANPS